ncbi:MAG TPA: hypothetical protein VKG05_08140 [Steroidobacteraceae bacterium]|nr:hypothetical protein [Steroidobacteraceae bacterium]
MSSGKPRAGRMRNACLIAAIVGIALLVVTGRQSGQAWLPSYLFVWLFVLSLSLGSLAWVAVHNMTGGHWGEAVRPFAQAALRLFPLCALLAIPLLIAPAQLLPWMNSKAGAEGAGLAAGQHWYLNTSFFYVRGVVYFVVWLGLARLLRDDAARRSRQGVAAIGFVLYALTTTFAAVDWTMSLTPPWHSTVFGLLIGTGQALASLAGAILCANALSLRVDAPLRARFHDLGNLSLVLVLVWTYLALMQFLIMWIEDLPDEIAWMLLRSHTSWSALTWFLVFTHFLLPFVLLLSRGAKRAPSVLAWIGALVLIACLADSFWLVVPNFRPQGFELQWSDLGALLAIGGLWLGGLITVIGLPAARPLHGSMASGSGEHGTQRA